MLDSSLLLCTTPRTGVVGAELRGSRVIRPLPTRGQARLRLPREPRTPGPFGVSLALAEGKRCELHVMSTRQRVRVDREDMAQFGHEMDQDLSVVKCVHSQLALALGTVSAAPSDPRLRQFLQKSLAAAAGKQELAKYFLAELLSEPSQTENEALESEDLSRGAEQDEVRLELERSANSNPALAPRERKAGCKNFFWKTFTSC
ncbi:PREDICTED: somatostatin-like [Tinamus guttatus]|uniref:somatostatin-like n=1 Tax=Tinamus guttatus TaxID=94827 RepID=UPI00052EF2D3|nr:PREDICTED: somatostatin-like [Tinamus guttatus]